MWGCGGGVGFGGLCRFSAQATANGKWNASFLFVRHWFSDFLLSIVFQYYFIMILAS